MGGRIRWFIISSAAGDLLIVPRFDFNKKALPGSSLAWQGYCADWVCCVASLAQIAVPAGQGRLLRLRGLLNEHLVHLFFALSKLAAL
jgi:hypothetical protein